MDFNEAYDETIGKLKHWFAEKTCFADQAKRAFKNRKKITK